MLHAKLLTPRYLLEVFDVRREQILASRGNGPSGGLRFSLDPEAVRAAQEVLRSSVQMALASANLVATRWARALAFLKHVRGACAVLDCARPLLNEFVKPWASQTFNPPDALHMAFY